MGKSSIVRHTGGGGNEPQGRQGFLSKIPFFKFFTKSKFSVSNVNKYYVGVKPQPTFNCVGFIGKRSIKNLQCHPELTFSLAQRKSKQKESATGWLSKQLCHPELVSGSCHRNIIPSPENINNIPSASRTAQRHVRGDLVPAFTLAEVFLPYYHSPRKVAFTLAEVLITLGIIGVVAAMTLPTLINDYKAKETVTRLKKVYSILNQAYLQALNDLGTIDNWGISESQLEEDPDTGDMVVGDLAQNSANLFWSRLKPYLKTISSCLDSDDDRCATYPHFYLGSSTSRGDYIPRIVLNDGTIFSGGWVNNLNCQGDTHCVDFSVDLNGSNRPNVVGRDIFYFRVYSNRISPMGINGDNRRSFEDYCLRNTAKDYNGYGCTAWVIYNENMDYLKCDGLSWSGKHKCK